MWRRRLRAHARLLYVGGRRCGCNRAPRRGGYGPVGSWHSVRARAEKTCDIACDQVDFEVRALPGGSPPEIGMCQRVRDDVNPEAGSRRLVYGEAHPTDSDRALRSDEGDQFLGHFEDETDRFGFRTPRDDARDAVDVTRHEMSAQFVPDPQRLFEIDECALLPPVNGCTC